MTLKDLLFHGLQDDSSPLLSDDTIIEVLFHASDDNITARTAYRCLSYIPSFVDASWNLQADARTHFDSNLLYFRRMIELLINVVRSTEENGTANRWGYGANTSWTSYDFLAAVCPSFVQFIAAMRGISEDQLRSLYAARREDPDINAVIDDFTNEWNSPSIFCPIPLSAIPNAPSLSTIELPETTPQSSSPDLSENIPQSSSPSSTDSDESSFFFNPPRALTDADRLDPMFYCPSTFNSSTGLGSELLSSTSRDEEDTSNFENYSWDHLADQTAAVALEDPGYDSDISTPHLDNFDFPLSPPSSLLFHDDFCDGIIASSFEHPSTSHYESPRSANDSLEQVDVPVNDSDDEVILSMSRFTRRNRDAETATRYQSRRR
ncbi:hypothetical protein BDZ89DRAFT_459351 [Hymenopellis radicata]|nr:hypothetical protein BDZ89DRAFT_459351 [Hymenopellis radicata]